MGSPTLFRTAIVNLKSKETSLENTKIIILFNDNARQLRRGDRITLIKNDGEIYTKNLDVEIRGLDNFEFKVEERKNTIDLVVTKSPNRNRSRRYRLFF